MATASKTKAVSLSQLKANREIYANGPSGNTYKIRPLNMERYSLAGGIPPKLREVAAGGAQAIDEMLAGDQGGIEEYGAETRDYLDNLVRMVIVEPELSGEDLDLLPPVDYSWALKIAMGEEERDGEGRRLWGRESATLFSVFTEAHKCADDCAACLEMRKSVSENQ